jgi:sensor histidine kinase YesM
VLTSFQFISFVEEREIIRELVQNNGGLFVTELDKATCTHLVAQTPDGAKYNYAKLWGTIRIVSKQWIEDCVRLQSMLYYVDTIFLLLLFYIVAMLMCTVCIYNI